MGTGHVRYDIEKRLVLYLKNRKGRTLTKLIEENVAVGTEIWTDNWKGYCRLNRLGRVSPYIHKTVNHSKNFVDPITGVCTNHVEGFWAVMKGFCRRMHVMHSKMPPERIDHFMWYRIYGGKQNITFNNIIKHITKRYKF